MGEEIASLLNSTWEGFRESVRLLLPRIVSLIALVVVGGLAAFVVRAIARTVMRWIRFDDFMDRSGLGPLIARLGWARPHLIVAGAIFWILWGAFILAGLNAVGFAAAPQIAGELFRFAFRLALAVLLLMVGYALANFLWRATLLWAANAGIREARLLGAMVRWVALVGTFAMALNQLGIGEVVMNTVFKAVAFGTAAGFALAFGLGGRHMARRFLERRMLARKEEPPTEERGSPHL